MGDFALAYVLIGVIGLIMLFCFLKMHEYLKQINEKMDKIISEMNSANNSATGKVEKVLDEVIYLNKSVDEIKRKQN